MELHHQQAILLALPEQVLREQEVDSLQDGGDSWDDGGQSSDSSAQCCSRSLACSRFQGKPAR